MTWELTISAVALLVSVIVAIYSYIQGRKSNKLQEEQTTLQRRVVELEEEREKEKKQSKIKAQVKAEVLYRKTAKGKRAYKLSIYNDGAGAAKNVRIFIDDKPVTDCGFILTDQNEFEVIAGGSDVKLPMATSFDSPSNWKTLLLWDDMTGTDNKFETILTE